MKRKEVIFDKRNYDTRIKDVVDNWRREITSDTAKNRRFNLGLHNGALQVLPHIWELPKITEKHLIKNWYIGNQR